jgi:hypothetical protein
MGRSLIMGTRALTFVYEYEGEKIKSIYEEVYNKWEDE